MLVRPLRTALFAIVLWDSQIQEPLAFRARCLGSLKSWGTRCVIQSLCYLGRSWELGVLSRLYGSVLRKGFMDESVENSHFHVVSSHSGSFRICLRELLQMTSFGASMRWGDVQEIPMSHSWSLFSNLVEFYPKKFRLSYVLNASFFQCTYLANVACLQGK